MKKIYKIEARVTREEKENIKNIANEKGMTVSSLILSSIENHIIVQIDTRDYMDLVIQVRRIGG
ncbi:plasmid mobilization protein, partial [Acinetobacter baumannii]|uniref:plasmid mobilization protein n=1 Tax=Acinetobacter baumannii TaxID=470 RepID=UPI00227BDC06